MEDEVSQAWFIARAVSELKYDAVARSSTE